ncbi:MAG TPA: hypothetical protein PK794_03845 [Armatimonadota bacterium]|nr:hypothetical protein [Armatimonadota bacterium]
MTDNLPPIVPPIVPPPPPTMTPIPGGRPASVTVTAVLLLVIAGFDVLACLPSRDILTPTAVLVGRLDSLLAIIGFVFIGVTLLRMRPWARGWAIRLLIARFVILIGAITYQFVETAHQGSHLLQLLMINAVFAVVFSIIMNTVFISLLCTQTVRAAFAARAEDTAR